MRNPQIDLLRFTGLAMVVLAHVGPPAWLFQLRNFDVPLMVLVSGMSFLEGRPQTSLAAHWGARFQRLVLPAWVFLGIYFLLRASGFWARPAADAQTIWASFLLSGGIGYLWILKIFLVVALLAPLLQRWNQTTTSDGRYLAQLLALWFVHEGSVQLARTVVPAAAQDLVADNVLQVLPYTLLFALGLRLPRLVPLVLNRLLACAWTLLCGLLALQWLYNGTLLPTQQFKYPPQAPYLAYALAMSLVLYRIAPRLVANLQAWPRLRAGVYFCAQNSIWIYLWHIALLDLARGPFPLRYVLVFGGSAGLTLLQVSVLRRYLLPQIQHPSWRRRWQAILSG